MGLLEQFANVYTYSWGYLYYAQREFDFSITAEKRIYESNENLCNSLLSDFKKRIENDKELRNPPGSIEEEQYQGQYYHHYYGDEEEYNNELVQRHRKSSLLSAFSLLEGQLQIITGIIEKEFDFNLKLKDLNGRDYLNKYWLYLWKVFEFDKAPLENSYRIIKNNQYVRNKLAHANSLIDENKKGVVENLRGLELRRFGAKFEIIIKSNTYVLDLINKIEEFINQLFIQIDKRYLELNKAV